MTTSAVETVRNIPLCVEKDVCDPMAVDDSGFPFDRDDLEGRDDHLRSQLDDIAKRHPEFAEHLEGFPFRSDSLGRRSRPPRPSDESEFRRFAGRPFGSSRFERFGFPFGRDPFEDERDEEAPREEKPPEQETRPRGRRQNIQQSNTVDLGQKQEPVNDRNQRSMSAPPPDNRQQQRFVSSINIPINRDGGMGDMGTQQSQPQQEKPTNKPTERVIPIHVEGRDEPVMPKHTGPSFSQPERIFGHRPSQFTQYVGRESPRPFAANPEWHHTAYARQEPTPTETMKPKFQQQQPQKFQQQPPPPQQQQQQQQKFQQQQQVPPQKSQEQVPPPQQQQPKQPSTPIEIIQSIQKDVSELMGQVEKFSGVPKDKQYLYLDEMLTRNLIKLDNVDTQGQENIRQARKEAIKCIESCIGILEAKAAANVPQGQPPEPKEEKAQEENKVEEPQAAEAKPEESQQPSKEENMEVEVKAVENKPEENVEPQPPVEEKMEVVNEPAAPSEPPKENPVQKTEESSQKQENIENKPDEEMKELPEGQKQESETAPEGTTTTNQEENKEDDNGEDKKEKKKGKKKPVKKSN